MIKVACAIIIRDGKMLLARRGEYSSHPFQWEFPGGKVNPGETDEECILREIREELELQLEIKGRLGPVVHDYGFKTIQLIPFVCFIRAGEIRLNAHIDFKWVKWHEAETMNISEADRELISSEKSNYFLKNLLQNN